MVRHNSSAVSTPLGFDKSQKPSSCNLKRAPKKKQGGLSKRHKRRLFSNTQAESIVQEMCSILPSVIQKVKQAGLMGDFCNFLRLLHENKLPLTNIALLLFFYVVRWYSLENTCNMEYSDEAWKFWKVMYKLFYGKALRFMGGMKTPSENCDGNPQNISINFAVPSQKNRVASFDATGHELPKEIPAGIIHPALEMKSSCKEYVLSFDGKKVTPGLNNKCCDQDPFGHEPDGSLSLSKDRLEEELQFTGRTTIEWSTLDNGKKISCFQQLIKLVSLRIKDLRT